MNTTHHRHTSPSRIERLLAHLASRRKIPGPPSVPVDLIHDIHVVPAPRDR